MFIIDSCAILFLIIIWATIFLFEMINTYRKELEFEIQCEKDLAVIQEKISRTALISNMKKSEFEKLGGQ